MLLKRATLEAIRTGEVTVAFRRWRRPTVKTGGRLRTAIGELRIDKVEEVTLGSLTARDSRAAGFSSLRELKEALQDREGKVYRIRLAYDGEDTRLALRERARIPKEELQELVERLARMDARARDGEWVRSYLELIERRPATRAGDLAASLGSEKAPFKQRVRRLKELGLTESLEVGYRLSPRGSTVLAAVRAS